MITIPIPKQSHKRRTAFLGVEIGLFVFVDAVALWGVSRDLWFWIRGGIGMVRCSSASLGCWIWSFRRRFLAFLRLIADLEVWFDLGLTSFVWSRAGLKFVWVVILREMEGEVEDYLWASCACSWWLVGDRYCTLMKYIQSMSTASSNWEFWIESELVHVEIEESEVREWAGRTFNKNEIRKRKSRFHT